MLFCLWFSGIFWISFTRCSSSKAHIIFPEESTWDCLLQLLWSPDIFSFWKTNQINMGFRCLVSAPGWGNVFNRFSILKMREQNLNPRAALLFSGVAPAGIASFHFLRTCAQHPARITSFAILLYPLNASLTTTLPSRAELDIKQAPDHRFYAGDRERF